MSNDKIWYVYHIIDPETNKVFYIGKGHGQRAYIHMTRALKWYKTGKIVPGANKHLYHKLLKIYKNNLRPIYSIVFSSSIEKEVLDREENNIKIIGLENLCNLTHGGEGESKTKETLLKISDSLKKFWSSDDGYAMKQKFSEERAGSNNPMWGISLDEETIKKKVLALLSVPRWNKGLKGDPRSKGPPKGNIPRNAIACRLINDDGRIIEASSIKELSLKSGVPLISINRIHLGIYKKNKKGWRFELINSD